MREFLELKCCCLFSQIQYSSNIQNTGTVLILNSFLNWF